MKYIVEIVKFENEEVVKRIECESERLSCGERMGLSDIPDDAEVSEVNPFNINAAKRRKLYIS